MKLTKSTELKEFAFVAIPVLTVIGFVVDLHTRRGVDDWIWYFMALTLTIFLQNSYMPFVLTGVFTALTLAGYYLSPQNLDSSIDVAFVNLLSGIGVMWVTATTICFQQKSDLGWRKSEARFSSLFKNMQAGFMHCRLLYKSGRPIDIVILSVNPAFERITGLRQATGQAFGALVPGVWSQQPEVLRICDHVVSKGKPMTFEIHLKALNVWLHVSAYSPAKGRFAATFDNITERKNAENAATLFRALIDRSSDGIEVVDPKTGVFHDVNEIMCRSLGYTHEEFLRLSMADVTPTVRHMEWAELMADLRKRRALVVQGLHQRKDGTTFPTEASIRWVELDQEYLVVVVRDISERKKAEAKLRQSEDRLRMVTENARVGLVMVNRDRCYTFANCAYFELLGLPAADIIGERVSKILAPVYEEQVRPRLDQAFDGKRVSYELRRPLPNEERFLSVKYEPSLENALVTCVIVVVTDITEQKRASREIQLQLEELQRWHRIMLGREERILGLKREVNELLADQKRNYRYLETSKI